MQLNKLDYKLQYNNWHDESLESRNRDISDWENVLELHNLYPKNNNAKILDAGCGMGRLMLTLKNHDFNNIKGVDIDASMIEFASKEGLDVVQADIISFLQKDDELYDVIYCFDIVEHLEKEEQITLFKLLNSHLKSDGFVVVRVPNALSPTAGFFRYEDFTHTTSYTPITIKFLCQNGGFDYVTTRADVIETQDLQRLKSFYAEIYRQQFFIEDVILTPNIVSVIFKTEAAFNDYLAEAKEVKNEYAYSYEFVNLKTLTAYYFARLLIKLLPHKLAKKYKKKIESKYQIAVLKSHL